MIEPTNGEAKAKPTILLTWNADVEGVELKVDGFKGLDMILAVLDMATEHFKFHRNMQRAVQVQQVELQAQRDAQIFQKLASKPR